MTTALVLGAYPLGNLVAYCLPIVRYINAEALADEVNCNPSAMA